MNGQLQLLGIFAHPHDCTHALGTCAHHIKRGDRVTIAVLTDGGSTHNEELWTELHKPVEEQNQEILDQSRASYVEQKTEEVKKACSYFGITDIRVLGYPDRPIRRTDEMVKRVADLICEVRPDVLIGELPADIRGDRFVVTPNDHTTCAAVVCEACTVAMHARQGSDRAPHRIARTYYLATEKAYDEVDLFIDISDQVENRIAAEMCFLSQGHTPEFARTRIDRIAGNFGWRADVAYAETFVKGNMDVLEALPVYDHDTRIAREMSVVANKMSTGKG